MSYFPLLRGKQFELVSLRENSELISAWDISPIIEPVRDSLPPLIRALRALDEAGASAWVIANPVVGSLKGKQLHEEQSELSRLVEESANIGWIYQVSDESHLAGLANFLENVGGGVLHHGKVASAEVAAAMEGGRVPAPAFNFYREQCGDRYRSKFGGIPAVAIEDGFKKQPKNSLYPEDEVFSDLVLVYRGRGFIGFGDYLVVGDDYSEGGGPALAVAIHITYKNANDDGAVHIKHFVSDSNDTPENTAGKFKEALDKLVAAVLVDGSMISRTSAINEFIDLSNSGHFPGLGYVKKLAIQHHLELMGE